MANTGEVNIEATLKSLGFSDSLIQSILEAELPTQSEVGAPSETSLMDVSQFTEDSNHFILEKSSAPQNLIVSF